jgi:hypothetical protein
VLTLQLLDGDYEVQQDIMPYLNRIYQLLPMMLAYHIKNDVMAGLSTIVVDTI